MIQNVGSNMKQGFSGTTNYEKSEKKRILLFTRYSNLGASSRIRSLQYVPYLESRGWQIDVSPLFSSAYLHATYGHQFRFRFLLAGYFQRLIKLLRAKKYDLIWIEKELFPFMPAWAELCLRSSGVRVVVDYDDAIFHRYDMNQNYFVRKLLGRKIDVIMRAADIVIAGNKYLAARAIDAGAKCVEIIPTVVDIKRYSVSERKVKKQLTIGWIGSPTTSRYLHLIGPALQSIISDANVRFVAVGANELIIKDLPIEVLQWSEDSEVESILTFDIGIMPLKNDLWEQGKCGYKLIQYMACGLPVIASPVGVNTNIVEHGANGLLAETISEWKAALVLLLNDEELRHDMGYTGRKMVQDKYSLQGQLINLESIFSKALT